MGQEACLGEAQEVWHVEECVPLVVVVGVGPDESVHLQVHYFRPVFPVQTCTEIWLAHVSAVHDETKFMDTCFRWQITYSKFQSQNINLCCADMITLTFPLPSDLTASPS